MNNVMPGSDGLRILEFEKKQWVEISAWTKQIDFSEIAEARPVVCGGGHTWWGQIEKSA